MRIRHWRQAPLLILGVFLGLPVSAVAADSYDRRPPTDLAVAVAIRTKLEGDREFDFGNLEVSCENGMVTLHGVTSSLLSQEHATDLSLSTRGVVGVLNELRIPLSIKSDQQLKANVLSALANEPATEIYQLQVEVADATATLSGEVESWPERKLAERAAKSVAGIHAVKNRVSVDEAMTRHDDETKTDIVRTYESSIWIDEDFINVDVSRGVVALSGEVGSGIEKKRAYDAAWVAGVSLVVDTEFKVDPLLQDRMRKRWKWTARADDQIRNDVYRALRRDASVAASRIHVQVKKGDVTLVGFVDNLADKRAAQEDAENIAGVHEVTNRMQIRPVAQLSDDEIAERLHQRLASHTALNEGDVNVSVADGLAVLCGQVPSPRERFAALRTAEDIDGISQIVDRLTVKQNFPGHEDAAIEARIISHLRWSPFVSSRVAVEVENGVATLRGQVGSVAERRVALLSAYEGGAKEVVDEIAIVAEEEPRRSEP